MNGSLLAETYRLLDECPLTLRQIAERAGVNYHWLGKFKQRTYENPGIVPIEALHRFLVATESPRPDPEEAPGGTEAAKTDAEAAA